MRPVFFDRGTKIEVAGLQQSFASRVGQNEKLLRNWSGDIAQPCTQGVHQLVAAVVENAMPWAASRAKPVQ